MRNKKSKKKTNSLLLTVILLIDLAAGNEVTVNVPIHVFFNEKICSYCENEIEAKISSYDIEQENNRLAA